VILEEVIGPLRVPGQTDRDRLDQIALEPEAHRVHRRRGDAAGPERRRLSVAPEIEDIASVGTAADEGRSEIELEAATVLVEEVGLGELAGVDESAVAAADDRLSVA